MASESDDGGMSDIIDDDCAMVDDNVDEASDSASNGVILDSDAETVTESDMDADDELGIVGAAASSALLDDPQLGSSREARVLIFSRALR